MYNGIGLQTPRGSGTSGYVQASLVSLKPPPMKQVKKKKVIPKSSQALIDHNKRRKVELDCLKKRHELERMKMPKEQIDIEIQNYRQLKLDMLSDTAKTETVTIEAEKNTEPKSKEEEKAQIDTNQNFKNKIEVFKPLNGDEASNEDDDYDDSDEDSDEK